jgi:hypothetical protein
MTIVNAIPDMTFLDELHDRIGGPEVLAFHTFDI